MTAYSYRVSSYNVTVSVTAPTNNTSAPITYEGQGAGLEIVRLMLNNAYGAFGHLFNPEASTPTDLDYALFSTFGESNVERLGPTPSYDPGIPEGAVT
jgi:hypothetical protein